MEKRLALSLIAVAVVVLALGGVAEVAAKAHVPLGRVQICSANGNVQNISARQMQRRIGDGACRLTACAFNRTDGQGNVTKQFIFLAGDECDPTDDNGDGFCDATGAPADVPKRLSGVNVTPACTDPF